MTDPTTRTESLRRRPILGAEQAAAMAAVWRPFWMSRAVVWIAGLAALAILGLPYEASQRLDPLFLTLPFESDMLNTLVAPAARWDAAHYLEIAAFGYGDPSTTAFFPLYPLLLSLGGGGGGSLVIGIGLSIVSALGAMLLLYRLVAIDFGARIAAATVAIVAWYPSSIVFSAVYTDALFLLLSVGSVLSARQGRWAGAGLIGLLAAASRSSGILLVIPLLAIYLLGPRADKPDAPPGRFGIKYRLQTDAAWIGAIPLGLLAYMAFLASTTGDPISLFTAQEEWTRVFAPLGGIVLAVWAAIQALAQLLPFVGADSILAPNPEYDGAVYSIRNVVLLFFLGLALWLLAESFRRLPVPYALYAAAGLALPLSVPALDEPLKSLPRFMLVIFPLWIALALWATERGRMRQVIGTSAVMLILFSGLFASWVQPP